MSKVKGILALLACAVLFASFSIFVRVLSNDLSAYQQIGFRNMIALVIAVIAVLLSKQSFSSLAVIPKKYTILYTITFPIAVIFYTLSVLKIKIVSTIFGLYLGALITSLFVGITFFKEKITKMKALSLVLVTIGLITYAYPFDRSFFSVGFLFAVLSGFFDATANSFRKYLAGKADRFVLVVLQMIGGLAVAAGLMVFAGEFTIPAISPTSWLVGGVFGMSLVAISYLTLVGFQNFDLNLGTVVLSSELFFASILALIFFGEVSSFTELLGGTLIILATVAANWTIQKDSRLFLLYQRARKIFS